MPSPFRCFLWLFMMITIFGLLVGTLNLMNPQAVHIPFGPNGESAEGIDGLIASVASSAVLGIVFGSVGALLVWIASWGVKKVNDAPMPGEHEVD